MVFFAVEILRRVPKIDQVDRAVFEYALVVLIFVYFLFVPCHKVVKLEIAENVPCFVNSLKSA